MKKIQTKISNITKQFTMQKLFGLFLAICLVTINFTSCAKKEPTEIKIGAVLPLTGDIGIYGEKMKNGIELAVEEINKGGGIKGKKLNVIYEDDQGDPKGSVSAFKKLITTEKVPVIIGGAISACALSVAPIADKEKVVVFSPAASSPKLTGISKYFFRNWPSDIYEGQTMGKFAVEHLKLNKVATLYVNNDWGVGLFREFKKEFTKRGGSIVAEESFDPGATDFRTQLTKVLKSNPQAIYVVGYVKELLVLLRQKEEMGIKIQLLSTYGFYDPQILKEVKKSAEGTIFTAPVFDPKSPNMVVKTFVEKFNSKYGVEPDIWSAQAYDAINIIALVLQKGARTSSEIRDEISKVKDFEGSSGLTSFDENGDVVKPLRFMMVRKGEFVDYPLKGK